MPNFLPVCRSSNQNNQKSRKYREEAEEICKKRRCRIEISKFEGNCYQEQTNEVNRKFLFHAVGCLLPHKNELS